MVKMEMTCVWILYKMFLDISHHILDGVHFLSPDIECAAIRIYKSNLMDLDDILDCLDMSESTFFCALNWNPRASMLMAMNMRALVPTPRKYSFQSGKNSWMTWPHGTRISRNTGHLGKGKELLLGFIMSQYFTLTIIKKKCGTIKTQAPNLIQRERVNPWWPQILDGSLLLMGSAQHDASLSLEQIGMGTSQMKRSLNR